MKKFQNTRGDSIDDKLRRNKEANALVLDLLVHERNPEGMLRRLNEAGAKYYLWESTLEGDGDLGRELEIVGLRARRREVPDLHGLPAHLPGRPRQGVEGRHDRRPRLRFRQRKANWITGIAKYESTPV